MSPPPPTAQPAPPAIAILVAHPQQGRLGHARSLTDILARQPVLYHTLDRAQRIARIQRIVVVHPPHADPLAGIATRPFCKPVSALAHPDVAGDAHTPRRRSARRWATAAWRGGLGSATAWDELLPAAPLVAALQTFNAEAAVLLGGDWCLFDPAYADALLDLHLQAPDAMKLTFTQAPPGLGPLVVGRGVLEDLARHHASVGGILAYNPRRPALDPIGREVNHPIAATVRDTARRFIYDTPAGRDRLNRLAHTLGDRFPTADAHAVTAACRQLELDEPRRVFNTLPPQITLELTPRRLANGPITPQHHVDLSRPDLDPALARDLLAQCAGLAVTFGGLGDATLHPDWPALAQAAFDADVEALHVETDLLAERAALKPLTQTFTTHGTDRWIDIVSVRLNADTAATYQQVMGPDRFAAVMDTLQWLFDRRRQRLSSKDTDTDVGHGHGLPWIVPRLVKTADTVTDMESFFERWMHLVGHAVIDRCPTGGTGGFALAPDQNPVPMEPPWKPPSPHQTKHRLTVLSDGRVTVCGQDWLGRAALGNLRDTPLLELWQRLPTLPPPGHTDDAPVCRRCRDWWSLHHPHPHPTGN